MNPVASSSYPDIAQALALESIRRDGRQLLTTRSAIALLGLFDLATREPLAADQPRPHAQHAKKAVQHFARFIQASSITRPL